MIVAFLLAGAAMLALAAGQRVGVAASLAFVAVVLVGRRFARHYIDESTSWFRGAHAERAVGDTLNALRRDGWILLHDVEQPGEGNIDHIASGPTGIFLVETKLRRYEVEQLTKVKRQAAKLHRQLGVWVTPVICLHQRTGKPFRVQGVWVLPHRELLPGSERGTTSPSRSTGSPASPTRCSPLGRRRRRAPADRRGRGGRAGVGEGP